MVDTCGIVVWHGTRAYTHMHPLYRSPENICVIKTLLNSVIIDF